MPTKNNVKFNMQNAAFRMCICVCFLNFFPLNVSLISCSSFKVFFLAIGSFTSTNSQPASHQTNDRSSNNDVLDSALVASVVVVVDPVLVVDVVSMMPDLVDSLELCCHRVSCPASAVSQTYNGIWFL